MTRLPVVITLRLDEATLASIRDRVGDGSRVRSLSQFIREGIRLRLEQPHDYTGWQVAARVAQARAIQAARYSALGLPPLTNAAAPAAALEEVARPDSAGVSLLRDAADAMHLSARGHHRVLRVARTLADLDGAEKVGRVHLAEVLSYRALTDEIRRAA